MKSRWLINLVLLAIVGAIATFLHLRPQQGEIKEESYEVSQLKLADFKQIKVEFPTQAPLSFEKANGLWGMTSPYKSRADQMGVQRILSIIAAKSKVKLPNTDPAKYGLDNPQIKLKLTNDSGVHEFVFGTFNPVTEEQYVAYQDAVYLLPVSYSEAATIQSIELVDKSPLSVDEIRQVIGLDLGRLEQWEEIRLNLAIDANGKWQVSAPKAKPSQDELNEWLDYNWKQARATSVEFYTPNRKATYPSFEVKLKNGKSVHFDKMQESPEYLLAKPDEGVIYHFPNDAGFTMVNPPINLE
jgi:hypothetical protein